MIKNKPDLVARDLEWSDFIDNVVKKLRDSKEPITLNGDQLASIIEILLRIAMLQSDMLGFVMNYNSDDAEFAEKIFAHMKKENMTVTDTIFRLLKNYTKSELDKIMKESETEHDPQGS